MKFVDCGAGNEYAAFLQAEADMYEMANANVKNTDFQTAWRYNDANLTGFSSTELYHQWVDGKNSEDLKFQALAQHWCGHPYTGSMQHFMYYKEERSFK